MKKNRIILLPVLFLFTIVSCDRKQEIPTLSISDMVVQTVAVQNTVQALVEIANTEAATLQPQLTLTAVPPSPVLFQK